MAKVRIPTTGRSKGPAKKQSKPSTRGRKTTEKGTRRPAPESDASRELAETIGQLGLDKKALDVVVLDVRGLASFADYFVVMTAESEPQMSAIADGVEAKLKEENRRPISVEGKNTGQWVLIDYGDVVAHVFYQDMRAFYDIEGLWADAPRHKVQDKPARRA